MLKTFLSLAIAFAFLLLGCQTGPQAGLMDKKPVGIDKELKAAGSAKIILNNDTNEALFFRIFNTVTNEPIGTDKELQPGAQSSLTVTAGAYYSYIIFRNQQDANPVYTCNSAVFGAGETWELKFSKVFTTSKIAK